MKKVNLVMLASSLLCNLTAQADFNIGLMTAKQAILLKDKGADIVIEYCSPGETDLEVKKACNTVKSWLFINKADFRIAIQNVVIAQKNSAATGISKEVFDLAEKNKHNISSLNSITEKLKQLEDQLSYRIKYVDPEGLDRESVLLKSEIKDKKTRINELETKEMENEKIEQSLADRTAGLSTYSDRLIRAIEDDNVLDVYASSTRSAYWSVHFLVLQRAIHLVTLESIERVSFFSGNPITPYGSTYIGSCDIFHHSREGYSVEVTSATGKHHFSLFGPSGVFLGFLDLDGVIFEPNDRLNTDFVPAVAAAVRAAILKGYCD